MSNEKKKIIHVDNLIIHAKEVKIIQEQKEEDRFMRRDPWGFFRGRERFNSANENVEDRIEQREDDRY